MDLGIRDEKCSLKITEWEESYLITISLQSPHQSKLYRRNAVYTLVNNQFILHIHFLFCKKPLLMVSRTLTVHRKLEYWNFARPFKIYVDGRYRGSLKIGETKTFPIEEGRHSIKIVQQFSLLKSQEHYFEGQETTNLALETSTSILGISANILLLFYILLVGLSPYIGWNMGTFFLCLTPITVLIGVAAFFILADRYIIITPV